MRTLEGSNRVRNGMMGIIMLVIVIGVGQSFASVPMIFAQPKYYAQFTDTGGLNTGDKVRIAGVDVGQVQSMEIDGDKVVIGYSLDGTKIGTESRANIRTDTILGGARTSRSSRGDQTALGANGVLPLGQTTTPYQIYDAFFDVTKAASGWDTADGQAVAERVVGDHRPDLPASERRARRRASGSPTPSASATTRSSNCSPTPTRSLASSATAAGRSTSCWSTPRRCSAPINERDYAVSVLLERVSAVLRRRSRASSTTTRTSTSVLDAAAAPSATC